MLIRNITDQGGSIPIEIISYNNDIVCLLQMKIIKGLSWILLIIYSLNSSHKANVDDITLMYPFDAVPKGVCNLTVVNVTTTQDCNSTSCRIFNISRTSILSEDTEGTIDLEVLRKIEYYKHLEKRIWSISPPILFGKKSLQKLNWKTTWNNKCNVLFVRKYRSM